MVSVLVPPGGVRAFMNKLLREGAFDGFGLRGLSIETFARFDAEPAKSGEPPPWGAIRPFAHGVIKQGGKPAAMRVVLSPPGDEAERLFGGAPLSFNALFDERGVLCTMGGAAKAFGEQKALDAAWGEWMKRFLSGNGIEYDEG